MSEHKVQYVENISRFFGQREVEIGKPQRTRMLGDGTALAGRAATKDRKERAGRDKPDET
jgi:hypothetical protein